MIFCKDKKPYLCRDKKNEMKRLFLTTIIVLASCCAYSQSYLRTRFNTEIDYSRTAQTDLTCSFAADYRTEKGHGLTLGYKLGSDKHFFNLAYQIALFKDFTGDKTFYIENRYLYRYFNAYKLQEFNAMFSLGYRNIHWDFKLGLCNRYIAEIPLRLNGGEGVIFEPMNVVFDIDFYLFPLEMAKNPTSYFDIWRNWNIGCGISNYREFIIERVTLFYYTMHGYYDINEQWRITGEAGLHPAGVLNLSSQYNGYFFNIGCTYKY